MSWTSKVDQQIRELEVEFERRRRQILEESVGPLRDELRQVEHEIAQLNARAEELRAELSRMTDGGGRKGRTERRGRTKRPPMTLEQKRAKVEQILREERVGNGYPFSAIAKRLAAEANLSPADLAPAAFQKFLPPGFRVAGSLRKKTFVLG